jgi:hypothetical protein
MEDYWDSDTQEAQGNRVSRVLPNNGVLSAKAGRALGHSEGSRDNEPSVLAIDN